MGTKNKNPFSVSSLIFLLCCLARFCYGVDIIRQGETMKDGDKLVSGDGVFELGFFSPENSSFRYVGIWYKVDTEAVVWVANRDKPMVNTNGVLRIGVDGNLVVLDGNGSSVWWSGVPSILSNTSFARLQKNGNLELSNDTREVIWDSFHHPTDTFLPGMKLPVSLSMGEVRCFRSWRSAIDPSYGNYSVGTIANGGPQIVIWDQSGRRRWRSGQWNGVTFTGISNLSDTASFLHGFKLSEHDDNGTRFFTYEPSNSSALSRFHIRYDGTVRQFRWDGKKWTKLLLQPGNKCDLYNHCGNYATCDYFVSSSTCNCLEGFRPKFEDQWSKGNWSGGCERRTELECQRGKPDGFKRMKCMKLPDFSNLVPVKSRDDCRQSCLGNCSCTAYAYVYGIKCMIWIGDLVDVQHIDQSGNLEFFYRLNHSDLDDKKKISNGVIVIISLVGACFLVAFLWLLWRYKKKLKVSSMVCCKDKDAVVLNESKSSSTEFSAGFSGPSDILIDGDQVNRPELPIFNFSTVAAATNNFCEENKLGQGGFGAVYKGKLPGGQEIAVKRLSRQSGQGLEEFKNEIILLAKLQHRNLVRLLGCTIQGEEKMLIYEYMPNKSLDNFLFAKQAELDWRTRVGIIEGIARGLLYLHRDSRLRIIHRDLKASNILLDAEMNPKISDFGMARIFGGNQNEANTVRVVGTYGYMSPEYAMEGLFSIKSDVYSFGVLLLEIVSGRRNTSFRSSEYTSLIAYAWQLWNDDKAMYIIDPSIRESCCPKEALKCIHIGMLCVQDSAMYRPTMATVVLMLESEAPTLPKVRQPTYSSSRRSIDDQPIPNGQEIVSSNDVTISMIAGR
ncbi:hypothetical protein ES319_A06G220500v1 [Gossypium barbadense]|uniref:Receptor-like serine/threonine-protein kinase n=1 Tax=Gossypium barbadense TaxID=3634 RepID=A0A5J5VH33_GOSBA|nr:hypothetical protein ES319_A06G220500v1 [Gossypium barbadense]